jgi:hypothetical protein
MKMRQWGFGIATALLLGGALAAGPASMAAEPIIPGRLPYPAGGTSVIGDGVDAGNRNAQLAETVPAQINQSWRAEPPRCPQSGGSGAVSISVSGNRTVVVDTQYQCSWLSAYETATGKLLWRHQYHFARMAKIDGSRVYLAHDNPETSATVLDAFNLNTGALLWTTPFASGYRTVFGSGVVMSGHHAVDAASGVMRFLTGPTAGGDPSLLIEGGRIIHNESEWVEAFSATTGKSIWKYMKPEGPSAPGDGTSVASLHNGRLYIPSVYESAQTLVLDAATGKYIRTLPNSTKAIAFDGRTGIFTTHSRSESAPFTGREPDLITAVDLETGAVHWRHPLDMADENYGYKMVSSAPIIANGLVWILAGVDTGTPGQLLALDEITGRVRSGTEIVCPPPFGGNLAIAQHRVFVPTGCGVQTYVPGTADITAPTVTGRTPAASATNVSQNADITAAFNEVVSGVNASTFTLKNPAGTVIPATVTYNETIRVATLNPTAALAPDTKYTATLTGSATAIRDASNNALATTRWTLTTGPAPKVTKKSPDWFATGVSQTADVTATFSEPVTGVSATTFTVKNPAGTVVPATVTYNPTSRVATLNPTAALAADTRYTATLTGGATAIRDVAGNPITDNPSQPRATTSWYFTTGPVPTVISRSPAANATGVSRTANITATFSEAVTRTSSHNHFMLTNATTGAMVPVEALSYNAATRVATLNPKGTLAANTKYTATLTKSLYGGILDAAGNPLQTTRWSFTTGP